MHEENDYQSENLYYINDEKDIEMAKRNIGKSFILKTDEEVEAEGKDFNAGFKQGAFFVICLFLLFSLISLIFN